MTEEEPKSPSRFRVFVGGVRLIFDSLVLLLALLAVGFVIFANGIERNQREPESAADGIAVLTGGPARIDEAMKLLTHQKAKRLLITGVNRTTSTEALKQLASQGDQLFACCVDIDHEARNTIDNATETSQWVAQHRYHSIIVVTSNYHMPRALAELGRVMPGVTLVPYSVVDNNVHLGRWWAYPGTTKLMITEYLKYLPALGRLGTTRVVSKLLSGKTTVAVEDASEP
ncbi:MAG: YdcF family protein [Methyloceanibacter sp.]